MRTVLYLLVVTVTVILLPATPTHAQAQRLGGNVGLGGQLGAPSGVTLKLYQRPDFAYDFLAAWDLDEFFYLNAHAIFERPIRDFPMHYFLGPGLLLGVDDDGDGGSEFVFGVSGNFGVNYFVERFEVYLQFTPRINLIPSTEGRMGAGIGVRYYF
jgi:hypothetical protein